MKESPREGMPQGSRDESVSRGTAWSALLKATQWSNKMSVENDYCIDQHDILNKKDFLEVIGIVALLQLIKG